MSSSSRSWSILEKSVLSKKSFHLYFLPPQITNFKQVNNGNVILNSWCRVGIYIPNNSKGITEDWKTQCEVKIPSGEMLRNEYL